ncbi:hypothetical protein CWS02_06385 [Enterobacter sp. EA-1]|nr:hypothetical protein CWS02_06385 [Enterobacter sp. EA-1]
MLCTISYVFLGDLKEPFVLRTSNETYLLDRGITEHTDGHWLVEIEGKVSGICAGEKAVLSGSIPLIAWSMKLKLFHVL